LADRYVGAIKVGTFLSVNLDRDKSLVHELCHILIFKAFFFHDVTPVARAVSNRNENGFVLSFGFCESLFAPRVPIHRVVGVLEQVRALFVSESVRLSLWLWFALQ
jgi:hypothetical protein